MSRLLFLAALFAAPSVAAQGFPAPGTGVFTWEPVAGRSLGAYALAFSPADSLYAVTDTVYVLEPAPEGPPAGRWRALGGPRLGIGAVLALDPAGDTLLVGRAGTAILSRSTDGGRTWADVNGPVPGGASGGPSRPGGFLVLPAGHAHAGRLLAGGGVLFSDDRGATWTQAARDNAQDYADAHAFAVLPSGRVLFGGFYGVAGSDDGGASYARTPVYGNHIVDGLAALATPGSTQSGAPSCGLADTSLCDGAVAVGVDAGPGGVRAWRTADGGRTWAAGVPLAQPDDGIGYSLVAGVVGVGPDGLGRAVAVLGRGMVYATADGGQSWAAVGRLPLDVTEGVHYASYVVLGPDGHLWVTTNFAGPRQADVFRSAEPAAAAFAVSSEAPPGGSGTRLDVRPNPSGGHVSVQLTLGTAASSVSASVYDALGRRVAVVHDGPLAAGAHDLAVNASGLAPGVYVVRVMAGASAASARLVVAR